MKKSSLVLLAMFGIALAAQSFATESADPTQATPQKTVLKSSRLAQCDTPAGKLRKECAKPPGAQSSRY